MDKCPHCKKVGYYQYTKRDDGTEFIIYACLSDNEERRSPNCYETQLAAQSELLRDAAEVVRDTIEVKSHIDAIHPDGIPAKYVACYYGMKEVFPKAAALLLRLKAALKEKP